MPVAKSKCNSKEREYYASLGVPYCDKCCAPRSTDHLSNETLCKLDEPETCPLIQPKPK